MANVLSQNEIDELLSQMASGSAVPAIDQLEASGQNVQLYDFATANRFPKDQIRTLEFVYENFSRLLSNHLAGVLRANCEVSVLSVEEISFFNYSSSLPNPTFMAVLNMPPLSGPTLMEISSEVVYAMINRLFGGVGSVFNTSKHFTEIELAITERIVRQFMGMIVDAWTRIIKIDAFLDRIETSSQFIQIVPPSEQVAVITLNVSIGDTSSLINICLPHVAVEPVNKQLNSSVAFMTGTDMRKLESHSDLIQDKLENAIVDFTVTFDSTVANVADVISLQVGDVIQLNHHVAKPLTASVENIPKFGVSVGTQSKHYAVQITDLITEEADYE